MFKSISLGEVESLVTQLTEKFHPQVLSRKVTVVKEMLGVMGVLYPGVSKWRGLLLHELGETLITQARMEDTRNGVEKQLQLAKEALEDGVRCLQYDKEGTYESEVCMKMRQLIKDH